MKNNTGFITAVLILLAAAGIVYCFIFFAQGNLSSNEQTLFNILLFICSSGLSWIVSDYFYKASSQQSISDIKRDYDKNLEVYATKASEKVGNLSAELNNLYTYLKESLEEPYDSQYESLLGKKERIYSAMQILKTLRSINDGSLSDWKGIITKEAEQKIEEKAEDEKEFVESVNQILSDYKTTLRSSETYDTVITDEPLKTSIDALSKRLEEAIDRLPGVAIKPLERSQVENPCPNCSEIVRYKQKPLVASKKWIRCPHCKAKLNCRWSTEHGFVLEIKVPQKQNQESESLDEDFLEAVKNKLPPQPWPSGTGRMLAEEMDVSKTKMQKAINLLIQRGFFKHQYNGVLLVPEQKIEVIEQEE